MRSKEKNSKVIKYTPPEVGSDSDGDGDDLIDEDFGVLDMSSLSLTSGLGNSIDTDNSIEDRVVHDQDQHDAENIAGLEIAEEVGRIEGNLNLSLTTGEAVQEHSNTTSTSAAASVNLVARDNLD